MFCNKSKFEALPADLQMIIRTAAMRSNLWMLSTFEAQNNIYLQKLINEHNVVLKKFPDPVLAKFKEYSAEVISEVTAKDPMSMKVYESFAKFKKNVGAWAKISEIPYYNITQ